MWPSCVIIYDHIKKRKKIGTIKETQLSNFLDYDKLIYPIKIFIFNE